MIDQPYGFFGVIGLQLHAALHPADDAPSKVKRTCVYRKLHRY